MKTIKTLENIVHQTEQNLVLQHLESLSRRIESIANDHAMNKSDIQALRHEVMTFRRDYENHMTEEHKELLDGFNRDPIEHARNHSEEKRRKEESAAVALDTKKKVIGGAVWALLAFIGTAVWQYLKTEFGK